MSFPLQEKMRGYKVKQREWRTDDDESIRNERRRDRKTMEEEQKRLHAVTKGFLRENQSQVTVKSLRRRWKWGGGRKRRKEQGLVEKKSYTYCHTSPCKLFPLSFYFKLWLSFSISIALGHQQSSRNFTVEKELKRADGMLRELWQMEKMRRDQGRSGGIRQVENVCVYCMWGRMKTVLWWNRMASSFPKEQCVYMCELYLFGLAKVRPGRFSEVHTVVCQVLFIQLQIKQPSQQIPHLRQEEKIYIYKWQIIIDNLDFFFPQNS